MNNHTPGPWREISAEIEGADGSKIGQLYARPEDNETWGAGVADANSNLVCKAPDLLAYKNYVEANLERIERGDWTPVCFDEFLMSEERETYGGAK